MEQSPKTVFKNINIASYHSWVDQSNSYLSFMTTPKEKLLKVLEECEVLENSMQKDIQYFTQPNEIQRTTPKSLKFDDKEKFTLIIQKNNQFTIKTEKTDTSVRFFRLNTIMYYLIARYNSGLMNKWIRRFIALCVGILRGWLITFLKLENKELFYGQSGLEVFTMILHNLHQIFAYYIVTNCLLQLITDYGRQYFLNKQLKNMIVPYRAYTNKYLPTVNFFDVNTANSWVRMKKQIKNYGY